MKSIKNIKRIYQNTIYISISIKEALKAQELRFTTFTIWKYKKYFYKRKRILKISKSLENRLFSFAFSTLHKIRLLRNVDFLQNQYLQYFYAFYPLQNQF